MFMMGKVLGFVLFAHMASVVVCGGAFERSFQKELAKDIPPATYVCRKHHLNRLAYSTKFSEYGAYQKFSFSEAEFNQKFSLRLSSRRIDPQRVYYELYKKPAEVTEGHLEPLPLEERPKISVTFHDGETSHYALRRVIFEHPTHRNQKHHPKYVQLKLHFENLLSPGTLDLYVETRIIEADEKDVFPNNEMDAYVRRLPQYGWTVETALTREEDLSVLVPVLDSLPKSQVLVYRLTDRNHLVINAECIYVPMYTLYLVEDFFKAKDLSKSREVAKEP